MRHDLLVEIVHALGIEGARQARGLAVVIDVLRSFTVSAYALAGGARECRLVTTTDQARALAATTPDAVTRAAVEAIVGDRHRAQHHRLMLGPGKEVVLVAGSVGWVLKVNPEAQSRRPVQARETAAGPSATAHYLGLNWLGLTVCE